MLRAEELPNRISVVSNVASLLRSCLDSEARMDRIGNQVTARNRRTHSKGDGRMMIDVMKKGAVVVAASMALASLATSAARAQDAKAAYEKNCVACHGASGKGEGPAGKMLKPPPADFATALKGKADADIIKVIKEGGKAVGKSAAMPAFGAKLKDDQIQGIVEYVKGLSAK
jgi:mono/diheme cytochrome c family protein